MSNHRLDYASRKISEAFARANERRDKQLVEQQEIQSAKDKLQQQLLILADLKAQIEVFKNADNGTAKSTNVTTNNITNADALNIVEERYRTSLITNMIQLIHSKRKMK